jgi:hypothetical protein
MGQSACGHMEKGIRLTWQLIGLSTSNPIMLLINATRVATRVMEYSCTRQEKIVGVNVRPVKGAFGTHPYRPPVRATLLEDTPLIVESSDEFPAANRIE